MEDGLLSMVGGAHPTFYLSPLPPQDTVSQFVIPAKPAGGGREPGSRQRPREGGEPDTKRRHCSFTEPRISPAVGGLVRNDGFGEL